MNLPELKTCKRMPCGDLLLLPKLSIGDMLLLLSDPLALKEFVLARCLLVKNVGTGSDGEEAEAKNIEA